MQELPSIQPRDMCLAATTSKGFRKPIRHKAVL